MASPFVCICGRDCRTKQALSVHERTCEDAIAVRLNAEAERAEAAQEEDRPPVEQDTPPGADAPEGIEDDTPYQDADGRLCLPLSLCPSEMSFLRDHRPMPLTLLGRKLGRYFVVDSIHLQGGR